jgi:2-C-methyl-D-erythritol 4-phosphate cytidylyltransferase
MTCAIIVAAGSSRRMGFDKMFAPLAGHPVVWHSIKAFEDTREIADIVIVAKEDRIPEIETLVRESRFKKVRSIIPGGEERHLSVWKGLQSVRAKECEYVAIHDGARPLVTPRLIRECINSAHAHGAACCASPIPDTVKRADPQQLVQEGVDRSGLWAMQTPQIFASSLILQAYAAIMARSEMVTDEVSAVQKLGKRIYLLRVEDWNFKITFPHDLDLAAQVLTLRAKKAAAPKLAIH